MNHAAILSSSEIGLLAGPGLMVLVLWAGVWLDRSERKRRDERPPQRTKLLRPPGHSLQLEVQKLDDAFSDLVFRLIASAILFGICLGPCFQLVVGLGRNPKLGQLLSTPGGWRLPMVAVIALASLLWAAHNVRKFLLWRRKRRDYELGLRGEQAVAEALYDPALAAGGYRTFHDVPGDGPWNIDHVVVGPGGVFLIETKTRCRKKVPSPHEDYVVEFDGRTLRFPWGEDGEAVAQVVRNAEWLQGFVADFIPDNLRIQPLLVVPGWYVKTMGKYPVKAMNAKYLTSFLVGEPKRFTTEQLKMVVRRLDERCRDVEF
ncbi:MAG: nuclease-related domain-containing protein [Verrucomicrobiia bacterium]